MTSITDRDALADFGRTMDRVCDDRAPVVITRGEGESVVMLPLDDYEALEETAYLLRSPANAQLRQGSIAKKMKKASRAGRRRWAAGTTKECRVSQSVYTNCFF